MCNIAFSARRQRAGGGRWGAATPWLKSSIPGLYSAPVRLVSGRHAQTHHHAQHDDLSKVALHSDIEESAGPTGGKGGRGVYASVWETVGISVETGEVKRAAKEEAMVVGLNWLLP